MLLNALLSLCLLVSMIFSWSCRYGSQQVWEQVWPWCGTPGCWASQSGPTATCLPFCHHMGLYPDWLDHHPQRWWCWWCPTLTDLSHLTLRVDLGFEVEDLETGLTGHAGAVPLLEGELARKAGKLVLLESPVLSLLKVVFDFCLII